VDINVTDTEVVALIAVAGTLGSGYLSYLAARRSTEVQLAGIETEMQKLQASHDEGDRQNRKTVYLGFLDAVEQLNRRFTNWTEDLNKQIYTADAEAFATAHTRLLLFGAETVVDQIGAMVMALGRMNARLAETQPTAEQFPEAARAAYGEVSEEIIAAKARAIVEMKLELGGQRYREELQAAIQDREQGAQARQQQPPPPPPQPPTPTG
jgi:hypothetical protein